MPLRVTQLNVSPALFTVDGAFASFVVSVWAWCDGRFWGRRKRNMCMRVHAGCSG